ncbi:MAG: peptide chain release factor N(5)-glutamine methyltransferase [Desulfobacteraceae bacterium]|jgi:release factor glutamine methyltransferase|nr:MAG: peptide chain release factor N(5)-glutamine methyltransferase [Desulfobacteraceae bacterium]
MPSKVRSIGELVRISSDYLKEKGVESPRLTAEVLLAHQLSTDRVSLYLNFDNPISDYDLSGYRGLVVRRAKGEPLQYITGVREFWSLDFIVNHNVLIPRPETELLVEQTLAAAKGLGASKEIKILELGTGSGAVAVSIAREVPGCRVWATDISKGALEVARENALRHGVADNITFVEGDLFEPFRGGSIYFDLIVSNPPYVSDEEWKDLPVEIKFHEPKVALYGGTDGIQLIDLIVKEAHELMHPDGRLFLEMAPHQTQKVMYLMGSSGAYGDVVRIRDYAQRFRIVKARKRKTYA